MEKPLWNFGMAACRTVRADISPVKRMRDALCMWERQLESKPRSAIGSGEKASEPHATTWRTSRSCGCLGKPRKSTLRWPSSGRNTWKDEPLIISLWAPVILASKSTCHGLYNSRPANSWTVFKMFLCMPFVSPGNRKYIKGMLYPWMDLCTVYCCFQRVGTTCNVPSARTGCWLMEQMHGAIDTESKYAVITCSRICAQGRFTAMCQEM